MKNIIIRLIPSSMILLINISFLGCSMRYTMTGITKPISEKVENISYSVVRTTEPTAEEPYLTLWSRAQGQEIKVSNVEYWAKRRILIFAPVLTTAAGLGTCYLLGSKGRVALGRDFGIFSIGLSAGMITYNLLQKSQKIWQEKEIINPKQFIPSKAFKVKHKGSEYSSVIIPDKNGNLKINILEFSPFYQEGKSFEISLYSPEGIKISDFVINTTPIASALKKAKILKYPPALAFSVSFDDSTGNKDLFLDGDETGRIILLIKNTGRGVAKDLEIRITSLDTVPGVSFPTSQIIDSIELMESKYLIIPVSATREVRSGTVELNIKILEPYFHVEVEPQKLKFETKKFEPPNLVIYDIGVEEGEVTLNKSANFSIVIQNQGLGRAEDVKCELKFPFGITFLGERTIFNFGALEPGAWQRIDFPVFVGAHFQEESLKITIDLRERREEFGKDIIIAFPLNKPIQKPKEIVIKEGEKVPFGMTMPPSLTVDVDIDIPETEMENPDAVALIIGNKSYEDPKVPNVEYADNDVKILKEYLKKSLGYKEENIIFLENAKKSDFERVFGTDKDFKGKLYNYVKPQQSDVFVYYTGHGAPDIETKSGYFVPVDCQPDYVRLNGYALETFYKNLLQIPAKSITVVIDACFSGASEKGMLIAQASPLSGVVIKKEISGNLNIFTSCGPDEISSWYSAKRHGLFTYFFLKGLRGEADKNQDKNITNRELKEYLAENIRYLALRSFNRPQNPIFEGDESRVILRLK